MSKKKKQNSISEYQTPKYNPRRISADALNALKRSVRVFGDLSGFVVNRRTKNVICANQRREALGPKAMTSIDWSDYYKVELGTAGAEFVSRERYGSMVLPTGVRFHVREVDWPEAFEKAANVAANNPELQGEFTPDLDGMLDDIQKNFPEEQKSLRFDKLWIKKFTEKNLNSIQKPLLYMTFVVTDKQKKGNRKSPAKTKGRHANGEIIMPDKKIIFRRANLKDFDKIKSFVDYWLSGRGMKNEENASDDYFVTKQQHHYYLRHGSTWIAIKNKRIIAWGVKRPNNVLYHLLIDGNCRGMGIGKKMLKLLNPDVIRSKTDQSTGDPSSFYEQCGYMPTSNILIGRRKIIKLMVKNYNKKISTRKK